MVIQQEFLEKDNFRESMTLLAFMEVPRLVMTLNHSHTSSCEAFLLGYGS